MKIHLADQKNQLAAHLEALKRKPVMGYDKARLKEKTTTIKLDIYKRQNESDRSCKTNGTDQKGTSTPSGSQG